MAMALLYVICVQFVGARSLEEHYSLFERRELKGIGKGGRSSGLGGYYYGNRSEDEENQEHVV